jgi:medium-chain acyl-[acyl-carrier-protein] hydrolase
VRLLCIPFAGGTSALFSDWHRGLPPFVEVCALELPGRRRRASEPLVQNMDTLMAEAVAALEPYLDVPTAIFGHCTGALIGFELARELARRGADVARLMACCARAPQLPDAGPPVHELSDAEILAQLEDGGGVAEEVLGHPELIGLVLPALRADCQLVERHAYQPGPPLRAPISAFGGLQDRSVPPEMVDGWRHQTSGAFSLRMIEGNHYLLGTAQAVLVAAIADDLAGYDSSAA